MTVDQEQIERARKDIDQARRAVIDDCVKKYKEEREHRYLQAGTLRAWGRLEEEIEWGKSELHEAANEYIFKDLHQQHLKSRLAAAEKMHAVTARLHPEDEQWWVKLCDNLRDLLHQAHVDADLLRERYERLAVKFLDNALADIKPRRGGSMKIRDFVLARLAEDERLAKEAIIQPCDELDTSSHAASVWKVERTSTSNGADVVDGNDEHVAYDEGCPTIGQAHHIVRFDPSRVIEEVHIKRDLITQHLRESDATYLVVLGSFALVYRDHPDYDREWELEL